MSVVAPVNTPPDLSKYSEKPEIKGITGAQAFCERENIEVTYNAIVEALYYKRTLKRFKIGRCVYFSERDLMQWIYSLRGVAGRKVS